MEEFPIESLCFERDWIKVIFNYQEEVQTENIWDVFTIFLENSSNDQFYFINLVNHYALSRPHQRSLPKIFMNHIFSRFQDKIDEIHEYIRQKTNLLKILIFPEDYDEEEEDSQENTVFSLISNDQIKNFISFLFTNSDIYISEKQRVEFDKYYYNLFDDDEISLIDFSSFFGSLNSFKFLLLNNCKITQNTVKWSIAGGNKDILTLVSQMGFSFEKYFETSVKYHRYQLTRWLLETYQCDALPLPTCVKYFNLDILIFILTFNQNIIEFNEQNQTLIHTAAIVGNLVVITHFSVRGANIDAKDNNQLSPLIMLVNTAILTLLNFYLKKVQILKEKILMDVLLFTLHHNMVFFQLSNI